MAQRRRHEGIPPYRSTQFDTATYHMRNVSASGFRKPNVYRVILGALFVMHLSVADYVPAEMSLYGLEPALAEKLKAYYERNYGNEKHWG